MQTVYLLKGCPGAGKSFYCRELMKKEPGKYKRINNDSLRESIDFGVFSPDNEKIIRNLREHLLKEFLRKGYSILIDNVNANSRHFKEVCKLVENLNIDVQVIERPFYVDLEVATERDSKREGNAKVGEKIVAKWWKELGGKQFAFCKPKVEIFRKRDKTFTPALQNENFPKAIICDLDGTYALIGDRSPYDAKDCDLIDKPNFPVIETVKLYYENGYSVLFCSGREDKYEPETRRFIEKYLPDLKYQLFMRKTSDQRKDSIIKEEIYRNNIEDKYKVLLVLDDRRQVVSKWRELGLTCFQVAEGDF